MVLSSMLFPVIFFLTIFEPTIFCMSSNNNFTFIDCIPRENKALLWLKASLLDKSNRLSSWNNTRYTCCTWQGIKCDKATGHVIELDLKNRLEYLNLSNAGFGGVIPHQLGNLSSLRALDLGGLQSSLRVDNLMWAGNLSLLESLDMSYVNLSPTKNHIATLLNTLPSLQEYIFLSSNAFEGTLTEAHLENLFKLKANFHSGFKQKNLSKNLYLLNCSIRGTLPRWLNSITNLTDLQLSNNHIDGSIPKLPFRIQYLFLSNNLLSGYLSECWGDFPSLTVVTLSSNQLSGPIPNSIGGAYSLTWLQLSNNSFIGQLPPNLKNCTQLMGSDIRDNMLSGKAKEQQILRRHSILFLSNVKTSNNGSRKQPVDRNHLTLLWKFLENGVGKYDSFNTLSEVFKGVVLDLKGLNLSHNHLRGKIPSMIGDMMSLESLDLSNNYLFGTIPDSLSKLTFLSHLNLSNNNLYGHIPTGPQLQTLNGSSDYEGNPGLCGAPLAQQCEGNRTPPEDENGGEHGDNKNAADKLYLYAFIVSGFATGFWGYFGFLVFKRNWRLSLFGWMDCLLGKMMGDLRGAKVTGLQTFDFSGAVISGSNWVHCRIGIDSLSSFLLGLVELGFLISRGSPDVEIGLWFHMPKSSRHKSHKRSKHSLKDYSDSEEDVVKIDEKSSRDESSTRGHRESASGEKRKVSSHSRESKDGKDLSGHGNGDAVEEYASSKRRKQKTDAVVAGDRWNGGGDERGDKSERIVEKEIHKGESLKLEKEIHKLKENSSKGGSLKTDSKSKSKRHESGSAGEKKEDLLSSLLVEKAESKSKGESKRKFERDSSSRREGKEPKEKDRKSEKEKNGGHESKSGDAEVKLVDMDVGKKQGTQSEDLVGERQSKRTRENNGKSLISADPSSLNDLQNLEVDKDTDKKLRKKREGSSERDKYYNEYKETEVRRLSSKADRTKDSKYRDKHKDGGFADKCQEDVRRRDEKYREEANRDNKYHDEKYREDGERDSRRKDDEHRVDVNKDSRRKDEKYRDNGERDSRRKDEKYHEVVERKIRKDDKYHDDRDHEDGDKDVRRGDERYYEDRDRDDRRKNSSYRDDSDRNYRHKEEKYREDTEKDVQYKDSKQWDGYDREKRSRDSKYRDKHIARDLLGDKSDPKCYRDDGYSVDHHVRKLSGYDESPTYDDRAGRYRDDQGRRRTGEEEDYGDVKSRSLKDQRYDAEKKSFSSGRTDLGSDGVRSTSRNVDVDLTSGYSRKRSSPTSGSHAPRDNYRGEKQDESKYRDYNYEERSRRTINSSWANAGAEKTPSWSSEKLTQKDDGAQFGDLSTEKRLKSDIRSSPLPLIDKSPSSSVDRRQFIARRNIDVDESTQRSSGGSRDWKDYPARENRTNREFGTDIHPSEDHPQQSDADTLSISSPFTRNSHFSSSSKLMPPPPPSLMGPAEDDGHRKPNMRHRRMGEPNIGRLQVNNNNNAWRGLPTWPPPMANGFLPFPHGPPPVGFHSVIQPFHSPSVFGVRPSLELSHHPSPYHLPDADRFAGPGRPMGWRSQLDDPTLHGWDTSNALFGDEPHIFGVRQEWDLARNIPSGRGWETSGDNIWKGASRTSSVDLPSYEKENNSIRSGDEEALGHEPVQLPPNDQNLAQLADSADDVGLGQSAKSVEKNDEIGSAVISSGDSGGVVAGKDDMPIGHVYLSKLDLSVDLSEPELFDKCAGLIDAEEMMYPDGDCSKILYMEDAESKMCSPGLLSVTLFASADDLVFKLLLCGLHYFAFMVYSVILRISICMYILVPVLILPPLDLQKSMSLYKRQKANFWSEYGEKPKSPIEVISNSNQEDKNIKEDKTEKLCPTDHMQRLDDKTEALQHDAGQSAGSTVISENPEEPDPDMDFQKEDNDCKPSLEESVERSDAPLRHSKDFPMGPGMKNEELESVDVKYGPLLNSDVSPEASEAVMPESVNLSRIHHSPESHKNFTNSTPKSLSTLPKHCPSKINPRAKFNLSEILGGRGLCNGEEGLQQELKNDISKEVQRTAPLPSSLSSSAEEKKTRTSTSTRKAFEKEILCLTGGFPGGEKGLKNLIEKNPPQKKGEILKCLEFDAKMVKAKAPEPPSAVTGHDCYRQESEQSVLHVLWD
ncbi:leucine-rich repeat receptor-like protein kinase family protein [Striga asiatica]|uniref:Leucine-rich repeat receptor-like protein kinase family protein n=1 Tax=Striga asiatica TaxID=4170 RepID=A0A5A7RJZ5_STRAF|nr:leucine-rich repeat receptor-like protein kinase family protein [Striga asiatica]